jgi:ankyrin repeat protein
MSETEIIAQSNPISVKLPRNPYPGLRAFSFDEWPVFFGRETMIQDVIRRMSNRHVVAVHGDSGSGKSSLIRAGVLPALEQDHTRADARWRTCIARPGNSPLSNLTESLISLDGDVAIERTRLFRRAFRDRDHTVARLVELLHCDSDNIICILLDQFEELFEYARNYSPVDAEFIVSFLVALANEQPLGLYVILTMRTEYLGKCAQYEGFAEIINDTQYLVPYMERSALLRAIIAPAELFGGSIDKGLAAKLATEATRGQDRLPLLQHGLNMMWTRKQKKAQQAPVHLTLEDVEGEGSLAERLSLHANEIMVDATENLPERTSIVEKAFRALIGRNADGLSIRRPQTYDELRNVTGAPDNVLQSILARFRANDVCFLQPYGDSFLSGDAQVNITHEALIRNWDKITDSRIGWLEAETNDSLRWQTLCLQAEDYNNDPGKLESAAAAKDHQEWLKKHRAAWAQRYGGDWNKVNKFLEDSLSDEATKWAHRGRWPEDVFIPLGTGTTDNSIERENYISSLSATGQDYEWARDFIRLRKRLIDCVKSGQISNAFIAARELKDKFEYDDLLDLEDRGTGPYQLHPAFWAAITGRDRDESELYLKDPPKDYTSIFAEDKMRRRTTSRSVTVLAWAAFAGRIDLVRRLIQEFHVRTDVLDTDEASILHCAAVGGHIETIKFLVENCHLDPAQPDKYGSPPIAWAIQGKHHDVVEYLNDKAKENGKDIMRFLAEGGWTPHTEAARADDLEYFRRLVEPETVEQEKFDLAHRTTDGQSLLHIACIGNYANTSEVAHYLANEKNADLLAVTEAGHTPLHFAAGPDGKLRAISVLLAAGEKKGEEEVRKILDAPDKAGDTPLHVAVYASNNAAVEVLLKAGAKPDIKNSRGYPPLIPAAARGDRISAEQLILYKASTDLYPDWGILHYAADKGDLDFLAMIFRTAAKIDWNMRDKKDLWTPLMLACRGGWVDCVTFLLEKVNADASLHGTDNRTALDVTKNALRFAQQKTDKGRHGLVKDLIEIGNKLLVRTKGGGYIFEADGSVHRVFGKLVLAARRGDTVALTDLLESDPEPGTLGEAIREASIAGHVETLGVLLGEATDYVSSDDLSRCAVEAAQLGHVECAKALIGSGARVPCLWNQPQVSAGASFLSFTALPPERDNDLRQRLQNYEELHLSGQDPWKLKQAQLSFFKGCVLVAVEHSDLPGQNEHFVVVKPDCEIVLLNWTNEPIYTLAGNFLDFSNEAQRLEYVRFFFHFVRGPLGRFLLVDQTDQISWTSEATQKEREGVQLLLKPLYPLEVQEEDCFISAGTVIFKNALFFTKVRTARIATKVRNQDGGFDNFTPGQNQLFDEAALLEDLHINIDPPRDLHPGSSRIDL